MKNLGLLGALVLLVLGAGGIFVLNPPHHKCDLQRVQFQKSQMGFLFRAKGERQSRARVLLDICKKNPSPGGCYSFFKNLRSFLEDATIAGSGCVTHLGKIKAFEAFLYQSLRLFENIHQNTAWLSASDQHLFCELVLLWQKSQPPKKWSTSNKGSKKPLKSYCIN